MRITLRYMYCYLSAETSVVIDEIKRISLRKLVKDQKTGAQSTQNKM